MDAAPRGSSLVRSLIGFLVLLGMPQRLEAQVGLSSGMAQVALVARVAPRGSVDGVTPQRETGRTRSIREASVTVRMFANTGYQLVVRGTGAPASRLWVRAAGGEFQEVSAGSSVTVVRDARGGGTREHQVQYRMETTGGAESVMPSLPVRYEIAISPTM